MRCLPEEAERQAINALVDWLKARHRIAGGMELAAAEASLDDAAVRVLLSGARLLPREQIRQLGLGLGMPVRRCPPALRVV
ncbi:MAG TPA: hypothetical protein VK019_12700 [Pseudomonas sp.]|nr:hypothetical protein [Pseudomonas sp.]